MSADRAIEQGIIPIKDFRIVAEALMAAQRHLEYCGFGDNWERECADEEKLPQKIEEAVSIARLYMTEIVLSEEI